MKPTREQILAEPAGQRLDALIAEYVMGTPFRQPTHGTCCTCQTCGWDYDECKCGFSESIAAAWEVVEKIRSRTDKGDWYVDIADMFTYGWKVEIGSDRYGSVDADAPTLPLAICRAALLATLE